MQNRKSNKKIKRALVCALATVCVAATATATVSAFNGVLAQTGGAQTESTQKATASPASLFTAGKGITVSANGKLPDYALNGQRVHQADWIALNEETITEDMLPASRTHGVKVVSNSETSLLEFNNVINVDGFTKDDTIVEFVPVTTLRVSSASFTGMKIWITDADDESNWICLDMYAVQAQFGGATTMKVLTSDGIKGAYRWGGYHECDAPDYNPGYGHERYEGGRRDFYGATFLHYYDDKWGKNSLNDVIYEPFSVHYDQADKAVWVSGTTYGAKACVLDLDHSECPAVGVGNEFKGFKNNRVKVALQTYNIVDTAEYVVLNVGNNPMNGTEIADTTSPEYLEYMPEGGLPVANVGREYKAFPIEYYDFYDGDCDYKVYVKKESEADSAFKECPTKAFTPTEQTRYVLRYVSKDTSGNERVNEYTVLAQYGLPALDIVLDGAIEANYALGNVVTIPKATASGGSGPLDLTIKVVRVSDGAEIAHDNKKFIPYTEGQYSIIYTVKDYVGNVYTESLQCNVTSENKPVYATPIQMYKKFVSGVPTQLPQVPVYDYDSVPGQRVEAKTEVTITSVSNSAVKETVENYVFTPDKETFGDKVKVEYKSYCDIPNAAPLISTFEVEIIEPTNSWDYLWSGENTTVGGNLREHKDKFASVTATADGDASVGFINPLQAEYLEFTFGSAINKDAFDAVKFEMVDFIDSTQRIAVEISKDLSDSTLTYVSYNGVKRVMTGAFGGTAYMTIKYVDGQLFDSRNNLVADFTDFEGFSSDRTWVNVTLVNAKANAELRISKIGTHNLFANYNKSGELNAFSDTVRPSIEYGGLVPGEADINTQVTLPSAKAFDACTPFVETFISVVSPSGEIIYEDVNAKDSLSFVTSEYGAYTVTYWAVDANNKKQNVSYDVYVYDLTKPYIVYNGAEKMYCAVGETLTFDNVKVYDAVDEELNVCVFLIEPKGVMNMLKDDLSFTFNQVGWYTLRYYVYDSNYNTAMLDVKILVTE